MVTVVRLAASLTHLKYMRKYIRLRPEISHDQFVVEIEFSASHSIFPTLNFERFLISCFVCKVLHANLVSACERCKRQKWPLQVVANEIYVHHVVPPLDCTFPLAECHRNRHHSHEYTSLLEWHLPCTISPE